MKRNYVPDGLTHRRTDIAKQNQYIDKLCAELTPLAQELYGVVIKRQMASEGAKVLIDEAQSTLRELLSDSEALPQHDEEVRDLTKQLEAALDADLPPLDHHSLVERGGEDLARAVVGFWFDLGKDELERYKRTF